MARDPGGVAESGRGLRTDYARGAVSALGGVQLVSGAGGSGSPSCAARAEFGSGARFDARVLRFDEAGRFRLAPQLADPGAAFALLRDAQGQWRGPLDKFVR